jgi:hypothetical protein
VLYLLIPSAWLTIVAMVVGACRVAGQADRPALGDDEPQYALPANTLSLRHRTIGQRPASPAACARASIYARSGEALSSVGRLRRRGLSIAPQPADHGPRR